MKNMKCIILTTLTLFLLSVNSFSQDIITKQIRNIEHVTATTTLSIIPEQDFEK